MGGTTASGVVLASSGGRPGMLANTMAHELGHYLGLFHTEDALGMDQLPDTGPAGSSAGNVMHVSSGSGESFSPQQGERLRLHPRVRMIE